MIASDKQVVHMYVNVRLPLAGGLIKQTTMALLIFLVCSTGPLLIFFGRPDGMVFLTVVPILPWFLCSFYRVFFFLWIQLGGSKSVEIKKSRHQVVPNTNSPKNTQSLRSRKNR